MQLLNLPPEILELVLVNLDPSSFSIMLMTCKSIRANVLASSKLLHQQLLRVPGLRIDDPKTNVEVLQAFTQRAAYHALNGANVLVDTVTYRPKPSAPVQIRTNKIWPQPKLSQIQRCCYQKCEYGIVAATVDAHANIQVYSARKGFAAPKYQLRSWELMVDDDPFEPCVRFKVVIFNFWRTAPKNGQYPFHTDRLTALYQYEVLPGPRPNRFIMEATLKALTTLKLVTWSIRDEKVIDVRDVDISPDEEAERIAVGTDRTVAIAFRLNNRPSKYRIRTYLSGRSPLCIGIYGKLSVTISHWPQNICLIEILGIEVLLRKLDVKLHFKARFCENPRYLGARCRRFNLIYDT
jgi:hypothetical protein